ncbi:peptidoglycan editing factor PgeF [Niveibacterium terrae]|uniref:peptidoglycan editing factor PgeF n=1 Tax=Niveibacterium terrae TaxID=3373598 RepID=UPI003A908F5D
MKSGFVFPEWAAPANVRALFTTRIGGHSLPPYAGLNLGDHVGDDADTVARNRMSLAEQLPASPCWLKQVHGTRVVAASSPAGEEADASVSRSAGEVCVVMVADCLPVLFCDRSGTVVAAAHAGWRGLAAGVLDRTLQAMACPPQDVLAWMGPAIGPEAFEVGPEVREAFLADSPLAQQAFCAGQGDRWYADIFALARLRLEKLGLAPAAISGGGVSTVADPSRFYSYRRERVTGRMAALIWLASSR